MKIILRQDGKVIDTYFSISIIPNKGDTVILDFGRNFIVKKRRINYINQEVILEGHVFQ